MRSHGILVLALAFGGWAAGSERGAAPGVLDLAEPVPRVAAVFDDSAAVIDCDDGNACTIDLADPALGCRWIPSEDGAACDGAGCAGSCNAGECTATQCDDDNPHTASACTPSGCSSIPLASSDDADAHACDAGTVELPGSAVVRGSHHSLALDEAGRLFAWGDNGHGQLGTGASGGHRHRPHAIGRGYRVGVQSIAAGTRHSVAIREDGTVSTWGRDGVNDEPRTGAAIPHAVVFANGEPLGDVTAVAAGPDVSFALTKDGTVWSWGTSGPGRLGDGTRGATHRVSPVQVMRGPGQPLADIVAIAADTDHATALTENGEVFVWGGVVAGRGRIYATPVSDPNRLASR